jgi:methionyl aminopeptidase
MIVKTNSEYQGMSAACKAAAEVLNLVASQVQPGRTTGELDELAATLIKQRGGTSAFFGYSVRGTDYPYPGHICVSINDEVVHGIPGPRRIQYGDVVSIDVGIVLDGFIGDNATTVPVGIVEPRTQELLQMTERALYLGIKQARAGNRVGDISHAIQTLVEAHGFSVVREFVGHGVGRKMHEDPQVPNFGEPGKGPRLKKGMTIAIEPMINCGQAKVEVLNDTWTVVTADGKPSAHFEHTVMITDDEPEILTWQRKNQFESKER